jgi:tetratricopeptide (TPR) repeat protein
MPSLSRQIDDAFDRGDWSGARQLIGRQLKREPGHHWLLARMSAAHFEEKNYAQALKYIKRALKVAPDCPLVTWDYAGTLLALGQCQEALAIYQRMLADAKRLASCPHGEGEGPDWGYSLALDCIFMIGVCHQNLGDRSRAADAFQAFIGLRARWRGECLHTVDEAVERLSGLGRLTSSTMAREVEEFRNSEALLTRA